MSGLLIILGYLLVFCEILWYFTCTDHEDVPLIFAILDIILCCIPGLNCILSVVNVFVFGYMYEEGSIELKDNWFNRKFLAYRG